MSEEKDYYYEVRLSYKSPDDKLERTSVTFLVEDFGTIEELEREQEKKYSKFLVEGYALRRIRNADEITAFFGEIQI